MSTKRNAVVGLSDRGGLSVDCVFCVVCEEIAVMGLWKYLYRLGEKSVGKVKRRGR